MVITERVKSQYFADSNNGEQSFIRLEQTNNSAKSRRNGLPWSADEHARFLSALEAYPSGPWKVIASLVGTRTTRQTMTHAQKYREKIARRKRLDEQHEALSQFAQAGATANATDSALQRQDVYETSVTGNATMPLAVNGLEDLFLAPDDLYLPSPSSSANGGGADVDETLDATIALLLESYEPLEIDDDDPIWSDYGAFASSGTAPFSGSA